MANLMNVDLMDVARAGRRIGRNMLMFELGRNHTISTTGSLKDVPSQLGDAVLLVVEALYRGSKRKMRGLTKQQVLDALMQEVFTRAKLAIELSEKLSKKESA